MFLEEVLGAVLGAVESLRFDGSGGVASDPPELAEDVDHL